MIPIVSARTAQIERKASEMGYRHIWTGAFHPPSGVTFWPDDDVEAFLAWGRTALEIEILYIDDFQTDDQDSEDPREVTMCFFMAQGICHSWASEAELRNLRGDVAELLEELEDESGEYEEVDYEDIHSQLLEYLDQFAISEEFVTSLSDPKFYRERGGPPTPFVMRLVGELNASRSSQNIDYYRYAGLIADKLGEVMTKYREATDKMLLLQLDDVRAEISKSDKEWTSRLMRMREKTVKDYLIEKYGFASAAIVSELARNK
jgi:hypothetical protein